MIRKTWFVFLMVVLASFAALPAYCQDTAAEDAAIAAADSSDDADDQEAVATVDTAAAENDIAATGGMIASSGNVIASSGRMIARPIISDMLGQFKIRRDEIQKLISQRYFARAEKLTKELQSKIKASKLGDEAKKSLTASLERREKVAIYSAQGHYQKAADAVRQAIAYQEMKSDKELLLKTQEKVGLQQEWLKTRTDYENQLCKLLEGKQPLLKEKLAILRQLDSKKKLDDAELKKLQVSLRGINGRLSALNKRISEAHRVFAVKREGMKKAGVILSAEQNSKLFPLVMKRMMVRFANYNLHKQIARHLTNISENNEITWKDLKENFAALGKLQGEIWDLRKRLESFTSKAPLSGADLKAAREIRRQLEKAISAGEKLLGKVEDAFIDQKVFGKLSNKEKLEFVKLFRDVWSREKEFDSLKPALEEIYQKLFKIPTLIDDTPMLPGKPVPQPVPDPRKTDFEGTGLVVKAYDNYMIKFNGKLFLPDNLPANYMIDNLEVKFGASLLKIAVPAVEGDFWWKKYSKVTLTFIKSPQVNDLPVRRDGDLASPTRVIEENLDNQDKPANLMNAF